MLSALSKSLLNTDRLGASTTTPGSLFPEFDHPLGKEMLPNVRKNVMHRTKQKKKGTF